MLKAKQLDCLLFGNFLAAFVVLPIISTNLVGNASISCSPLESV